MLASLLATGAIGGVLATAGTALAPPAGADGPLLATAPDLPNSDLHVVDLPQFPSWINMTTDGGFDRVNETNLGAMFDEFGPGDGEEYDGTGALAVNDVSTAVAGSGAVLPSSVLAASGDLTGDGQPEVWSWTPAGGGVVRGSADLDDTDALGVVGAWSTVAQLGDLSNASAQGLHGRPVAMGLLDGRDDQAARGVWLVTDQGFVLALFGTTGTPKTFQIPLATGERVLDATSPSVLDSNPGATWTSTDPPPYKDSVGVLTTAPAPAGTSTAAIKDVVVIGTAGVQSTQTQTVPWAVGTGALRRDFGRSDNDLKTFDAALLTNAADARQAFLYAPGHFGDLFCPSSDPNRKPAFDMDVWQGNNAPTMNISCAADGGLGTRAAEDERQYLAPILRLDQVRVESNATAVRHTTTYRYGTEQLDTGHVTAPPLRIDRVMVDLPCAWLRLLEGKGSTSCAASSGIPQRTETIVQGVDPTGATQVRVLGSTFPDNDPTNPVQQWSYGQTISQKPLRLSIPLPQGRNQVTIQLADRTKARIAQGNPRPMVLLAAPPYVRGAGQVPLAGPTYNVRTSTGSTRGEALSDTIGVSLGFDADFGLAGVSAEAQFGSELGTEVEQSIEVESSEQFVGSPTEDTLVYSAPTFWQYDGTIVASTTGVGIGDPAFVNVPRSDVITSATLSLLQTRWPDLFTGGDHDKGMLNRILTHTDGDPGTYTQWGVGANGVTTPLSTNVSDYCDGASFTDTGKTVDERGYYPYGISKIRNAFADASMEPDPPFTGPGILASAQHTVQVGSDTSEGAGFSITSSASQSRLSSMYIGVEASAKVGGIQAGASWEHSFGRSWGSSFSSGVDFLGYVGHIPDPGRIFQDETYDWRIFLCKKSLNGAPGGLPIWVMNYTVDGYHGSGGMEELGDIELGEPIKSGLATTTPTLSWSEDGGTVKNFDIDLEAIGANDVRSAQLKDQLPQTTIAGAKARDLSALSVPLASKAGFAPLLSNQLYRWRVTSKDFLSNTLTSDWEYFVTDGPPTGAGLTLSDPTISAGDSVTLTATNSGGGAPTSYTFDLGDGRAPVVQTGRTLTTTYATAGLYPVKVTMSNARGSASANAALSVGPVAKDESYAATEDTTLTKTAANGVKANDSGQMVGLVSAPSRGTVDLRGDGSFTYVPDPDACGADTFTYGVMGGSVVKLATTTINVACVNDAPTVGSSAYAATEDITLAVDAAHGLLKTARDVDGDTLHAKLVTGPASGTLTLADDGSFTYAPAGNACGEVTFTYRAEDASLRSADATATISVACVNDQPVATPLSYAATEDQAPFHVALAGTDVETPADRLAVTVTQQPSKGTLVAAAGGGLDYVLTADACGADSFTYTVTDEALPTGQPKRTSAAATVSIAIACVNDAPVITTPPQVLLDEDSFVVRDAAHGLRTAATDVDTPIANLRFALVTGATKGTAAIGPDGAFGYQPNPDACGTDSFTYTVSDGVAPPVGPATVSVTIRCLPDAPRPAADQYDAVDAQPLAISAADGVLRNDVEVDGEAMTVAAGTFTTAAQGTLVLRADGSATYTAPAGFSGDDQATYTVSDPTGRTAVGTIAFHVKARTTLTAQKAKFAQQNATVRARLVKAAGSTPVVGATIRFVVQGRAFCTAVTGADGWAQCTALEPSSSVRLSGRYVAYYDGSTALLAAQSPSTAFGTLAI